jgi:hypothetical protein
MVKGLFWILIMSALIINNPAYALSLNFGEKSDYMSGGRIIDPYEEVLIALEGTRRLDAGDHVNGTFEANESAVEFYFIHKEDYPTGADLDPTLSIYQAYSIRGRFELDIPRYGGWLFVIVNNYNETQHVTYEMSIKSVPIFPIVMQTTMYGVIAAVLIGVAVYVFQNREPFRKLGLKDPRLVGLLMGAVALLAPFMFSYYPSVRFPEVHIGGLIWGLSFYTTEWRFGVDNPLDPFSMSPGMLIILWIIGIRLLFAYQTMRYFQRKTTKVRMLAVGVLAELPLVPHILLLKLYEAILIAIGVDASIGTGFPIPIPCMLVISLLLLRFVPISSESMEELKSDTRKLLVKTSPDSI